MKVFRRVLAMRPGSARFHEFSLRRHAAGLEDLFWLPPSALGETFHGNDEVVSRGSAHSRRALLLWRELHERRRTRRSNAHRSRHVTPCHDP